VSIEHGVLLDDNIRTRLESVTVEAYLSGAWVEIQSDIVSDITIRQGISGGNDTDLIASPGQMSFVLKNHTGKYYIAGASPLSGWGNDVKIRCILTHGVSPSTQFVGWVRDTRPAVEIASGADRVSVTCYCWLEQASRALITLPSIQRNKTTAGAAQAIIAACPIPPDSTDIAAGTTFLTVFDTVRERTTAFAELAKVAYSEFGHLYMRRDGTLVIESGDQRDSSVPVKKVPMPLDELKLLVTEDGDYITTEDGDYIAADELKLLVTEDGDYITTEDGDYITEDGDYIAVGESITLGAMQAGYTDLDIAVGAHYLNHIKIVVEPRRVDTAPAVIASTPEAVFVEAGQSKTIKLNYTDPSGRARRVAAITDEMETPTPGGTVDTDIKLLLRFEGNFDDSTGNHTVTERDTTLQNGQYKDGYKTPMIPNGIMGGYVVYGGYPDYNLSFTPVFSLLTGAGKAFTVGCWVCLIDITSATGDGDAVMARHSGAYPPWLFGYFDEPSMTWRFYASTNGSSWDYANGVIMGKVAASSWQWLEWGHKNGWNYLSVNGKVQPPFYSASVLPAGSGDVSVGLTRTSRYMYFGQDEVYINNAKCLHTADFDPPNAEISIYKDEDYWGNLAQDKTGTDITDDVIITPTYGTEAVSAVLTNNASDGYISYQQRGIGVYFDGTQDAEVEYSAGVNADGDTRQPPDQAHRFDERRILRPPLALPYGVRALCRCGRPGTHPKRPHGHRWLLLYPAARVDHQNQRAGRLPVDSGTGF